MYLAADGFNNGSLATNETASMPGCKPTMTVVELYAGAGGMSLGLQRSGFHILRAYDHKQYAVDAYNRNVGYHAMQADLTNVAYMAPGIARLKPRLVAGGPPCQDFSPAGLRMEGERANHTRIFALYVCCIGPEWFIMENVQRARRSAAWADAREILKNAGYGLTEVILDASYYRVAQARRRMIVIGRRGERDGFMLGAIQRAASPYPMPLRALFGDRIGDHVYSHPRNPDRRGVWSVDGPSPTIRNARRPQPSTYEPHRNDSNFADEAGFFFRPFHDGRGVYGLDEPAPAILRTSRERPRQSYLDKPHARDASPAASAYVLTQKDTSLIQGFPEDWDWSGLLSRDVDQMIANAVPAPMAAIIGAEILRRDRGESHPDVPGNFGQWLAKKKGMPPQVVANVKWRVKQAWVLLDGRDLSCRGAEAHALEEAFGRKGVPAGKRSDIRRALKTFRNWQDTVATTPKRSRKKPRSAASGSA